MQVRLRDRLDDHGLISVVICRTLGQEWEIDTWLMSCRVIGRRVEEAVCGQLVRWARERGMVALRGRYRPTPRNALVRELYGKLGFHHLGNEGEESLWRLPVSAWKDPQVPIAMDEAGGLDP
ncbi:MAG: hypothetical protein HQL63_14520 [Magnetococcales bacterium]|nr:hypothetical protein [Magnetococcales bacterium]